MILCIAPIHPSHAAINLLCIYIDARAFDARDEALLAVLHERGDFRLFAETHIRERLFRLRAEWLVFLWRVYLG